jgi:hypothetical protein
VANELQRINPPPTSVTAPATHIALAGDDTLTRGERKTVEEYRTQIAVITGQAAKTIYAEQKYGQLVRQVHDTAIETLRYIEQSQGETKSPAILSFCEREKQLFTYQALEMMTTGGQLLHQEVSRSLYPTPRRGLLDR